MISYILGTFVRVDKQSQSIEAESLYIVIKSQDNLRLNI